MPTSKEKLRLLLEEMVQTDQSDLDFGIYRIMNVRRSEILRYVDETLFQQVQEALQANATDELKQLREALAELTASAIKMGFKPEESPRYKELQAQLADAEKSQGSEDVIFSHLYDFFRRYYQKGDFLALPRYKAGVYALPYNGEEVKLHWANADQYYVKSSEYFRDYSFHLPEPDKRRVHFRLAEADTAHENAKATEDRVFALRDSNPATVENGELTFWFHYAPDPHKRKQDILRQTAADAIRQSPVAADWLDALLTPRPTDKNPRRTLLDVKLLDYTARNTFDYFIHKDLGGFLRRELDFYVKNEMMRLDDIESETAPRVEQYLNQIRAVRRVAHKIIAFVAQIEDFQKRLWLKKKFVVETQYGVTLDRVPESLYPQIAANAAQREAWIDLFKINEIAESTVTPGYSTPLTVEFLKANPYLVLDTCHFNDAAGFKDALLASPSFDDLDANTDGLLVNGDNFHALSLLQTRYREQVKCIYIDPPYNTSASEILYKNDYKHSSWLSLLNDRLHSADAFLSKEGIVCITIDDLEFHNLWFLISRHYSMENQVGTVPIRNNPQGRATVNGFAVNHEYALFFARDKSRIEVGRLERTEAQNARYGERDENGKAFLWENFRKTGTDSSRTDRPKQHYPIYCNKLGGG